jgi:hypothetical protein
MPLFHASRPYVVCSVPKLKSGTTASDGRGKRPRQHWEGPHSHGQSFRAGEIVRRSGIYEPIHEGAHREPHEVVMVESDLFPSCDTCSGRVRFRLIRTAPYIFTDEDFERPK